MATGSVCTSNLSEKLSSDAVTDESSESDGEPSSTKSFQRRISTSKAIKSGVLASTNVGPEAGSAQTRQLPSLVLLCVGWCRWNPNPNLACMGKKGKKKKSVLHTEQKDTLKEILPSSCTVDVISKTVRFLVLSVPNNSLLKKYPFAIQKGLYGISKNLKSVKKLASGDLLLERDSALQSKAFLVAKTFLDLLVTITPHKTCQGVVSDDELLFSSDVEILEGLSSQGVVNVRRILTRKGTDTIPTNHIILTSSSIQYQSWVYKHSSASLYSVSTWMFQMPEIWPFSNCLSWEVNLFQICFRGSFFFWLLV
ncbi:hypothetical protein AVEN_48278-1 [Araneus ventricosus]|uniref:Uncharacterized protein n=1 Tax=Araneus ventricosus TaxID=182803 RepID=A0A4Y2EKW1_ARAVE|nr:hypothetical protein AVEN_48278-1 [Araneus ventricosus]